MKGVRSGLKFVSYLPLIFVLCANKRSTALGVGEKAVSDTSSRPDIHHDGSEYSEGQRQRALGLEEIKFFRAIGEGDTPSTVVDESDCTPLAMVGEGAGALTSESNLAQQLPTPPETAATLPTLSDRALKGIMDQRGPFELPTQPKPRVKRASAMLDPRNESPVRTASTPAPGVPRRDEGSDCAGDDTPRPTHPGQIPNERLRTPETESTAADSIKENETNDNAAIEDRVQEPSIMTATSATLLQPAPSLIGPSVSAPTPLETSPPQSSQPTNRPSFPPAPPQIDPNIRVLVVDDDALTRRLMQRMLIRLGCTVETAENGKIALEKILNGPIPPGVLSLERGMPPDLYALNPDSDGDGKEISHVYLYDVIFLDNQMVSKLRSRWWLSMRIR